MGKWEIFIVMIKNNNHNQHHIHNEKKIKVIIMRMRMRMRMRTRMKIKMTIINKIFFSEQNIRMSYYLFNSQEILEKAKKRYSKEKAAEYYLQNKKVIK